MADAAIGKEGPYRQLRTIARSMCRRYSRSSIRAGAPHQQVEVAVGPGLAAGARAEDAKVADAVALCNLLQSRQPRRVESCRQRHFRAHDGDSNADILAVRERRQALTRCGLAPRTPVARMAIGPLAASIRTCLDRPR